MPYNATVTLKGLLQLNTVANADRTSAHLLAGTKAASAVTAVVGREVSVSMGGSAGYPLTPAMAKMMPLNDSGALELVLTLGGAKANDWFFIKVVAVGESV